MIFSLPKLMALAGVIWAVWMGFKYLERRKGGDEGADSGGDQSEKGHRALDLEECRVCRAWVAGEACEREACPYRGGNA